MNLISTDDGQHFDLDDAVGQYEYVARFLKQHGATGTEFAALAALSDLRCCSICGKTFKGDACPGASEWDAALKAHVHPANNSSSRARSA